MASSLWEGDSNQNGSYSSLQSLCILYKVFKYLAQMQNRLNEHMVSFPLWIGRATTIPRFCMSSLITRQGAKISCRKTPARGTDSLHSYQSVLHTTLIFHTIYCVVCFVRRKTQ